MKINNKPMKYSELIRRFAPYYIPFKKILIFDLFCAALSSIAALALPPIVSKIINLAQKDIANLTPQLILILIGLYILIRIIDSFAYYYMATTGHIMGVKMEANMRIDLFKHLQTLPLSYYHNNKIGQIMARISNDLNDITEFAHHCPEEFFIAALKFLVSFIILIRINIVLTILVFALIPLMYFGTKFFSEKMRSAFKESRNQVGEINSKVEDSLLGVKVVKSFSNEDKEIKAFDGYNNTFIKIKKRAYKYMGGFQTSTRFFEGLMNIIVIGVGAFLLIRNKINPGDYVAFILFVSTLIAVVRTLILYTEQFQRGITGIERFFEVMDIKNDIIDDENAIVPKQIHGNVEFKNVSFSYDKNKSKIISNLNEKVEAGSNIAIVGPSGAGKTTLVNLLPRFYDVEKGKIFIDGMDIKKIKISQLRKNIGMVQQDVYLFSSTVLENIQYGRPEASYEEVIEAAKLAGAHDFIMQLENKYDTYIGERGAKLSGGQKQRISIARLFLKNPPILILDEATSALDNESEKIVQQSLAQLAKGRTTFTIAHRLTTIKNSDCIWVMTDQGIVEKGDHETLMKKEGIYKSYYNMYLELDNE